MNLPPLILASASPRRAELLRQLGVAFQVIASDTAEVEHEHLTPREICQLNACRKARAVAKKYPDALVLGADTMVVLGMRLFGKPADLAEAHRMLAALAGQQHQVVTGLCLVHLRAHRQKIFCDSTNVWFRNLDETQIGSYLQAVNPLDKAGAYALQEQGDLIVEKLSGSRSNVIGLPLERLRAELAAWGG